MDVTTLVKNIITAYEDAAALVQRIRQRKEQDSASNFQEIDDLLDSLSLGPNVVRGYYESDAKRFGSIYMTGDSAAREQLKDALINLQMTVISSLGAVMYSDKEPDYDAIQAASDDCRVNVGVCLGQLSQRTSRAIRASNNASTSPAYENGQNRPMQRSLSQLTQLTQSSALSMGTPMTPPESDTEHFAEGGRGTPNRTQRFNSRPPAYDVMDGMHTTSYAGLYSTPQENAMWAPMTHSRASSSTLPSSLDSPISPQLMPYTGQNRPRDLSITTNDPSPGRNTPAMYQSRLSQEGLKIGESQPYNHGGYFHYQQQSESARGSQHSDLTSGTLGRNSGPSLGHIDRKPLSGSNSGDLVQSPMSASSYSRNSMPHSTEKEVYVAPPPAVPIRSVSRREAIPIAQTYRTNSTYSIPETEAVSQNPIGPLVLPTDKNLLGFCKGAFRLQAGMEKKAFVIANRPVGFSNMLQYWKCDKCYFEGICASIIPPGGKKPERVYDPAIREYSGIRYRWAFLAKCHVALKTIPEGRRDGSYGSFCCIFCVAEGVQRGWPKHTNDIVAVDKMSIKSGKSADSMIKANLSGPVFGSIHGFMDHLQMHRQSEFWPGVEMQSRMKCIVGRFAQVSEKFDINLPPA